MAVLFLCLLSFGLLPSKALAQDATTLPQGGTTFTNAVQIVPGSYVLGHEIESGVYEFFTIHLSAGQSLRVEMTTSSDGYGSMTLYDSYKKKQTSDTVISDAFIVKDISITATRDGDYYFSIGHDFETNMGTLYDISYQQANTTGDTSSQGTVDTASGELTAEEIAAMATNPASQSWGQNWFLIVILTVVVMVISFLLFRQPGKKSSDTSESEGSEEGGGDEVTEASGSEEGSSTSVPKKKGRSDSPFAKCLIVTFIAIIGAVITLLTHNPVWVLILLLPATIYEAMRTQEGATTKTSAIILLIVLVLEIGMIAFNISYNLIDLFGEQEKYIAGYYLPLGDIKVFGPILATVLSLILLVRTYGPYTKWLSIVIAIGSLLAIYIINPFFFQNMVKIIADAVVDQIGSYM